MDHPHKITVLRGEVCVEGDTCPMIARLDGDLETWGAAEAFEAWCRHPEYHRAA